jgi:hypothetical protein
MRSQTLGGGTLVLSPFVLSLSKDMRSLKVEPFDKLRANGLKHYNLLKNPFVVSPSTTLRAGVNPNTATPLP